MEQKQTALEYFGSITEGDCRVVVRRADCCYDLAPRFDLRNHSPTGYAWGYGGSGPAQLALALLADYFGSCQIGDIVAQVLYQDLKWKAIAPIPIDSEWKWTGRDFTETLVKIWEENGEHLGQRLDEALQSLAFEMTCRKLDDDPDADENVWARVERDFLSELAGHAAVLLEDIKE